MATPHITAEPGDFASATPMPDDPKRAQRTAELLTDDVRLVTDVRGMLGFTGTVNGRPLSVMGPGMRQPSFTIYATELFSQFGVGRIIRVGTAGVLSPKIKVGDVIMATGARTDSSMNQLRILGASFSAVTDFRLAPVAYQTSQLEGTQAGGAVRLGTVMPRDYFYFTPQGQTEALASYEILGVEIEAVVLYGVAVGRNKQALATLTVSDHLLGHSSGMSAIEHETRFIDSLRLAVAAAYSWSVYGSRTCRPIRATRATATPLGRGGHSSPRPRHQCPPYNGKSSTALARDRLACEE